MLKKCMKKSIRKREKELGEVGDREN